MVIGPPKPHQKDAKKSPSGVAPEGRKSFDVQIPRGASLTEATTANTTTATTEEWATSASVVLPRRVMKERRESSG